jgi:ATP-binding cassette subfamily F protein 3
VDLKFSLKNPYGTADLFMNTKLIIPPNKRCAVYGINGSGKTCLFAAIASGEIQDFPKHMSVHHMKELEHDEAKDRESVLDTVLNSHEYRNALLYCERHLTEAIAAETNEERLKAMKANLDYVLQQKATVHGEQEMATKVAVGMLRVLGFDEIGEKATLASLSGGLRMRVGLACAFFADPDILLLDEPTNHLDLPSVLWLENRLRAYKGSFLLVTHDRVLLENVVTSVMLIQDMKLENYTCSFKEFEIQKEKNDKDRVKQVEEFMRLNRNVDCNNPKYKIKMNYEKWLEARYERGILLQGKFTFASPAPLTCEEGQSQSDISLIKVDNLRFSYDPEKLPFIFDTPINYEIKVGTRVGIIGPNGAGKSTLLKLVTGKLNPTTGAIIRHPDFVTAYFGQHSTKELDLEKSAMEFMTWKFPKSNTGVLRSHLAKTSVGDSIADTRMKNLSFSQRSCVIFAALTFVPPHLLIMDEPTNFLDLDSVDSLIQAANKFKGGLVIVTHNRDFLKKTAKTFVSIIPGAFLEFDNIKDAERATYSFITALESGGQVDVKSAILENRGGGSVFSEEDQAIRNAKLAAQQKKAQAELDAVEAEKNRLEREAQEKEKARVAKLATLKENWVAGEKCWAPIKSKWVYVEVVRNVPSMGVTCRTPTGDMVMVDAKRLREQNPEGTEGGATTAAPKKTAPAAATGGRGGKGTTAGGRGGSTNSGRGGARGGTQNAGGRGGARGGRK